MRQFHLLIKSGLSKKSLHLAWFHFLQHPIRLTTFTVYAGPTEKSDFMTLSTFVLGPHVGNGDTMRTSQFSVTRSEMQSAQVTGGHVGEPRSLAWGWGQGCGFERLCYLPKT